MKPDDIVDIQKSHPLDVMRQTVERMPVGAMQKNTITNMINQSWNLALQQALELMGANKVIHMETIRKVKESMKDRE